MKKPNNQKIKYGDSRRKDALQKVPTNDLPSLPAIPSLNNGGVMVKKVYRQKIKGITEESIKYLWECLPNIGKVEEVKIEWDKESCDYTTTVVGSEADVEVFGFSVGYGGEGPSGLVWLLGEVGMTFQPEDVFGSIKSKGIKSWKAE